MTIGEDIALGSLLLAILFKLHRIATAMERGNK